MKDQLAAGIQSITKSWTAAKRHADKEHRIRQSDLNRMRTRHYEVDIKTAAYAVMKEAYLLASGNGRYPAAARQVMYQARPLILKRTTKEWSDKATPVYFTQHLLPDFMDDHPDLAANWDVVWDDRGHFAEPHTKHRIGIGGLAVRRYVQSWAHNFSEDTDTITIATECPTTGPTHRYQAALFLEKEGFNELLIESGLLKRYDLALMSTKGMSVTAARRLIECLSEQGIPTLVARDFDKAGFSIAGTLRSDTRRYWYRTRPNIIDIGLRLTDVQVMGLEGEPVEYDRKDPRYNLREHGATDDECTFLVHERGYGGAWHGDRVELNAMTSPQFLIWLEEKFKEHGITKVIPDDAALAKAYRRAHRIAMLQRAIDDAKESLPDDIDIPDNLRDRLTTALDPEQGGDDARPWDEALAQIVQDELPESEAGR